MQVPTANTGEQSASRFPYPQSGASPGPHRESADLTPQYTAYYPDGDRDRRLAKALGWFSIGIGVAGLLAPRSMSRAAGVTDHPLLVRAIGMREIASGIGILSERKPTGWLWSRVAGDAMDLALLGMASRSNGVQRNRVAVMTAAVAGVAALDVLSSVRHTRHNGALYAGAPGADVYVEKSITVNCSADDCYRFWRDFENFPRFMHHIESVQTLSDKRSHWRAKSPIGTSVEWDAEVTTDQPGKVLAWRSLDGSDVDSAGVVRFERAPGGRGTILRVQIQYSPPGGKTAVAVAKLFGEAPGQRIEADLRHFKQFIETGEIPTTVGQSSGRRSTIARLLRKGAPG